MMQYPQHVSPVLFCFNVSSYDVDAIISTTNMRKFDSFSDFFDSLVVRQMMSILNEDDLHTIKELGPLSILEIWIPNSSRINQYAGTCRSSRFPNLVPLQSIDYLLALLLDEIGGRIRWFPGHDS